MSVELEVPAKASSRRVWGLNRGQQTLKIFAPVAEQMRHPFPKRAYAGAIPAGGTISSSSNWIGSRATNAETGSSNLPEETNIRLPR